MYIYIFCWAALAISPDLFPVTVIAYHNLHMTSIDCNNWLVPSWKKEKKGMLVEEHREKKA